MKAFIILNKASDFPFIFEFCLYLIIAIFRRYISQLFTAVSIFFTFLKSIPHINLIFWLNSSLSSILPVLNYICKFIFFIPLLLFTDKIVLNSSFTHSAIDECTYLLLENLFIS